MGKEETERNGIFISDRELVEWIQVTRENNEAVKDLIETLRGNGKRGLVREVDELKWKVKLIIGGILLFMTPVIGLVVSFLWGLWTNRIEVIVR